MVDFESNALVCLDQRCDAVLPCPRPSTVCTCLGWLSSRKHTSSQPRIPALVTANQSSSLPICYVAEMTQNASYHDVLVGCLGWESRHSS